MVAAAGLGVARVALVIGARLRAIEKFASLAFILDRVNNRFVRMAKGALLAAGALDILRRVLGPLLSPITGLAALAVTSLAVKQWLDYTRAVRNATVQLRLGGLETGRITQRLSDMRAVIGNANSIELFQHATTLAGIIDLGKNWSTVLFDIATAVEKTTNVGFVEFLIAAIAALKGEEDALERLKELFPELEIAGRDAAEAIIAIGKATKEFELTNFEKLNDELIKTNDRLGPILATLADMGVSLALGTAIATRVIETWVLDMGRDIKDFGLNLVHIFWDPFNADSPRRVREAWGLIKDVFGLQMLDLAERFGAWLGELSGKVVTWGIDVGKDFISWISPAITAITDFFVIDFPKFFTDFIPDVVVPWIGDMSVLFFRFFTESIPGFIVRMGSIIIEKMNTWFIDPIKNAIIGLIRWINENLISKLSIPGLNIGVSDIPIPNFKHGGVVPGPIGSPRLILAHGGERILSNSQSNQPMIIQLTIGDQTFDAMVDRAVMRTARFKAGLIPRGLTSA